MESKYIEIGKNKRLHYVIQRFPKETKKSKKLLQKNKQPFLFFLHGVGSNYTVFKPFFHQFPNNNIITFDIRSHGKSSRADVSVEITVEDMKKILDKEKIKNVILIGHSLGATNALYFYKKYPKYVKKMLLFTLASKRYMRYPKLYRPFYTILHAFFKIFKSRRKRKFIDYSKYLGKPFFYYLPLDIQQASVTAYTKLLKEIYTHELNIENIKIPTKCIIAKDDHFIDNYLLINDGKKNKLITYSLISGNHILVAKKYETIIKILKEFIEK
jgi:pimeloyl-ACP methyl ester carboxylesterase